MKVIGSRSRSFECCVIDQDDCSSAVECMLSTCISCDVMSYGIVTVTVIKIQNNECEFVSNGNVNGKCEFI